MPQAPAAALAKRIAGCYHLENGPWRADSVRIRDVSTAHTPLDFELTTALRGEWDSMQSAERPYFIARKPGVDDQSFAFRYWQPLRTTPVSIVVDNHPMAFESVRLVLRPTGKDLVGTVIASTDMVEPGKPSDVTRPVRAHRVPCSAP